MTLAASWLMLGASDLAFRTDSPTMWIDAHCHLAQRRLMDDVDAVVARSRHVGVGAWIQGGVDPDDWARQRQLAGRLGSCIVTAFGLHPWWVSRADDEALKQGLAALEAAIGSASFVGEMGLDRAVRDLDDAAYERQRTAFARQLEIASATCKPVVLHVVRAHAEAARMIVDAGGLSAGGIVHAFSGTPDEALAYARLGLHISVSGAVARPGFNKLKEAVRVIPRERLLVETDAPDGPLDDAVREPRDLPRVAEALAALVGASPRELLDASAAALRQMIGKDERSC